MLTICLILVMTLGTIKPVFNNQALFGKIAPKISLGKVIFISLVVRRRTPHIWQKYVMDFCLMTLPDQLSQKTPMGQAFGTSFLC